MNYNTIKTLANEAGVRVNDLIALAPQNDPFYVGRPAEVEAATWFANWWSQFGYSSGIHLRRIHYRMVSQSPVATMPNGKPYENTLDCWAFLNNASKWARYLDLVDPAAFVDRRNPDAKVNTRYDWEEGQLSYSVDSDDYAESFPQMPDLELPDIPGLPDFVDFTVDGYQWLQPPIHVEVWCEKTTMNDILEPICASEYANLVTGAGELSITATLQFMERVAAANRPARIIYISDFDPAGLGMPISVARKIEYWQHQEDAYKDLDIRLEPIVLTLDQVTAYRLPRIPVKESDRRKDNWRRDFGSGAVELDALEALHPGELQRIIKTAIRRYRDDNYSRTANKLREDLLDALEAERREILSMPTIANDVQRLIADYRDLAGEFEDLRQDMLEALEPFMNEWQAIRARLGEIAETGAAINQRVADELNRAYVGLDQYALPEPEVDDPDDALYDSRRDYTDQLVVYKSYRHEGHTNGVSHDN